MIDKNMFVAFKTLVDKLIIRILSIAFLKIQHIKLIILSVLIFRIYRIIRLHSLILIIGEIKKKC